MKKIGLFFCSILVALCSVVVPRAGADTVCAEAAFESTPIDMYLIGGQSNAAGYSRIGANTTETFENVAYSGITEVNFRNGSGEAISTAALEYSNIKWQVTGGLGTDSAKIGPEYGMAKVLNQYYTGDKKAFIFKTAAGGTSLLDKTRELSERMGNWYPRSLWEEGYTPNIRQNIVGNDATGILYEFFVENFRKVYNGLVANGYAPQVKGMVWMQGETDLYGDYEQYGDTLKTFISDIMHRILTLSESVYSRKIDQLLESGKFGLECKNVQEETNNTLTWVTVEVPEQYRTVGIHNMRVGELIVDNPNYMFAIADETNKVRLTVWDAPEFYAGVQDVFSITGRGTVLSVQIANGTVNIGDQLHINELGKVFTVTAIEKNSQAVETATAGDTVGLLTKDVKKDEVKRGYTITKLDTVASYDKFTATIRVSEDKKQPMFTNYKPNARFIFIEGIGEMPSTITFPTGVDMVMPGYTLEDVTVGFKGAKVPAFVGRRFLLIEGGKTVAEGVVTDVAPKTSVSCTVSEPTGKTAVIEPIQGGEKTFALNLNRSTAIENLVDSEAIDVVVKYNGVIVGSYKRTGIGVGKGDLAHVENGGTLQGSYININLAKGVAGLTDADGNWICEHENVTFDVSAKQTQQVDNLAAGSVTTISIGANDVKYFTLNELEPLTSGWYSFVNAFNNNGSRRYEVYTDAGEKVDMMSDTFKSNGGKYYVRYTVNANILNAQIGFIAAKGELEATNITTGLQLPAGKKGDRVVIKVTVKRAITYFHTNYVRFTQKVGAFNGRTVKVFYADYSQFDGMEYTTLSAGDRFQIPNRNNQEIYVYILMEYAADVAANTAELKFINSSSADSLPVVTTSGGELKSVNFTAKEFKNFYFKVSTPGKYRIEIVQSDSSGIVPFSTIGIDKLYDFNFNPVNMIGSTDFNVTETGNYSITLKNHTDSAQNVRIHVVKVS